MSGSKVILQVEASGSPPLAYLWLKDRSVVPGSMGATLSIENLRAGDAGTYRVVVRNQWGTVTSQEAVVEIAD